MKPSLTLVSTEDTPLQCSCLENLRDGGAWWAAVYGVSQSQTRLKWLRSSSSRHWGVSQEISCLDLEGLKMSSYELTSEITQKEHKPGKQSIEWNWTHPMQCWNTGWRAEEWWEGENLALVNFEPRELKYGYFWKDKSRGGNFSKTYTQPLLNCTWGHVRRHGFMADKCVSHTKYTCPDMLSSWHHLNMHGRNIHILYRLCFCQVFISDKLTKVCWPPQATALLQIIWGFPGGSDSKESACSAGDPGSVPRSGRSPGEGNGNPFQ